MYHLFSEWRRNMLRHIFHMHRNVIQAAHYEKMPMQYTEIFKSCKKRKKIIRKFLIFFLFLLKTKAVLMSTRYLCFGAKIRKLGISLHAPVLLYKSWV